MTEQMGRTTSNEQGMDSKDDWHDEKDKFASPVAQFLHDYLKQRQLDMEDKYDSLTELHYSGADGKAFSVLRDDPKLDFVQGYYEKGELTKMHVRVAGSTMDIYISGQALDDLKSQYLDPNL